MQYAVSASEAVWKEAGLLSAPDDKSLSADQQAKN